MTVSIPTSTVATFCEKFSKPPAVFELLGPHHLHLQNPTQENTATQLWISNPKLDRKGIWYHDLYFDAGNYCITNQGRDISIICSDFLNNQGLYINIISGRNNTYCQILNSTNNNIPIEHIKSGEYYYQKLSPGEKQFVDTAIMELLPGMLLKKKE